MADTIAEVTDNNFQAEVIESEVPVLVDFWAPWCGPCRMVAPVVEEIAEERGDALKVVKLNIDENQNTAVQFNVMSIPTLMLFRNGEVAKTVIGAYPKRKLEQELEPSIGPAPGQTSAAPGQSSQTVA
jgi:thioredoxin